MEAAGFKYQAVILALADHDALRLAGEDLLSIEGDAAAGSGHHLGSYAGLRVTRQAEGDDRPISVLYGDRDAEAVPAEEEAVDHVLGESTGLHEVRADARRKPAVEAHCG